MGHVGADREHDLLAARSPRREQRPEAAAGLDRTPGRSRRRPPAGRSAPPGDHAAGTAAGPRSSARRGGPRSIREGGPRPAMLGRSSSEATRRAASPGAAVPHPDPAQPGRLVVGAQDHDRRRLGGKLPQDAPPRRRHRRPKYLSPRAARGSRAAGRHRGPGAERRAASASSRVTIACGGTSGSPGRRRPATAGAGRRRLGRAGAAKVVPRRAPASRRQSPASPAMCRARARRRQAACRTRDTSRRVQAVRTL